MPIPAQETSNNRPCSHNFAPVIAPTPTNPSRYISQPLPPLPAFDALDDPGAFMNDCKEALRVSLGINSELGMWDPVVEGLPPNFLMNLGANLDGFEWPETE
jgi:hypothetical protein